MIIGAWIHNTGDTGFAEQFSAAARAGLSSVRGYSIGYSELVAPFVRENDLSIVSGIHVDAELRERGDDWNAKRFTARLSFGLARVIDEYRSWLDARGHPVPLTYAMEGIVFDDRGDFREHLWPATTASLR
ncbi:MAG: hypothetical protein ACOC2Q_04230 [Spirochaetota bacterium]